MYIYYKGLIIRKGNAGLPNDKVKELYVDAGWQKLNIPQWQHEKF